MTVRERRNVTLTRFAAIVITTFVLFPFVYVLLTSFKLGQSFYSSTIFPREFTLQNYKKLFTETNFFIWMKNSIIMGSSSGIITVIITMFGGYAFSRLRFPGKKYGILFLMIIQMLPTSVAMVAYFRMLQILGLINTLTGIILILGFGNTAFGIWIMRNYLISIPKDLDEAAYIDGASHWQTFWKIIFPLMLPILATQFILTFIGVYNEYMLSVLLLFDPKKYPIGVGVKSFLSGNYSVNWTIFCAASVIGSLPIIVIFFLLQKHITEGLTRGAVKS
jgi:arabinogalactan oligomer/maltooligosaccharide transport system permease protein